MSPRESLVLLELTHSFGPLPALLTGCGVPESAAFVAAERGAYARRDGTGAALLDRVELSSPSGADVSVGQLGVDRGDALAGPWPDVVVLVLDAAAQAADPFTLGDDAAGWPIAQGQLAAELLIAARRGGRGAAAEGILPPGVGPSRPPRVFPRGDAALALAALAPDAPTLRFADPGDDPLLLDVVARLALLLRARGWASSTAPGPGPTARLLTVRAPCADPAVALLAIAGALGLHVDAGDLPELLSIDPPTRAAAAWAFELQLLRDRAVLPLLQVTHWIDVHPRLSGVRLRADGVPILDDAAWSAP